MFKILIFTICLICLPTLLSAQVEKDCTCLNSVRDTVVSKLQFDSLYIQDVGYLTPNLLIDGNAVSYPNQPMMLKNSEGWFMFISTDQDTSFTEISLEDILTKKEWVWIYAEGDGYSYGFKVEVARKTPSGYSALLFNELIKYPDGTVGLQIKDHIFAIEQIIFDDKMRLSSIAFDYYSEDYKCVFE